MALPTFLCIGATKAGTTWLNDQLEHHPGVCMPLVKELHYFSALSSPNHHRWAAKAVTKAFGRETRKANRAKKEGQVGATDLLRQLRAVGKLEIFSEAWYRAAFERPGRRGAVCGEITPAYAELSDEGIGRVLALVPDIRIIHLLRHPLDRTLSHLRMAAFRHEAEATEAGLMAMIEEIPWLFTRGAYETQVPRWRRLIPADQMMFVPFGQVRDTPRDLLRRVEDFIGVPHYDAYPLKNQVNTTRPVEIPLAVQRYIEQRIAPTIEFLRAEFGEDFLNASR